MVLVFTVMTLMLCAFATTWQQRAKQNQVELARKDAELQALAYDALFPLIMSLGTEDRSKVADPSSGVRQALRDSVRKIEALEASMLADVVAYKALEQRHPFTTSRDVLASVPKKVLDLFGPLGARSANASVDDAPAKPPAAPPDAASTATHGPCDAPTLQASIDALGKLPEDASSVAIFESVRKHDLALLAKFRCDLELDDLADRLDLDADETLLASLQFSLLDAAPSLKVHDAWALPMLYGMLGALIYHLRNYLNNLRPDPSFVLVVMRVFLGGFAGIAIGWFWRPENGEALGVADITLSTLSLAFLVGFAIDVFLKLLDRLVTLVSGWVGNLGAAR